MRVLKALVSLALILQGGWAGATAADTRRPLDLSRPAFRGGWSFPELLHSPVGLDASPSCRNIRTRHRAELAPLWRSVVDKIALTCRQAQDFDGADMVVTTANARLRPGSAFFAGIPVVAIVLSDTDLGFDHDYVLQAPYEQARARVLRAIEKQLAMPGRQDSPDGGLFWDTGEGGGAWLHPDPDDPHRTIFAVAWSE